MLPSYDPLPSGCLPYALRLSWAGAAGCPCRGACSHQYADMPVALGLLFIELRAQPAHRRELPVVDGDGLAVEAGKGRVLPVREELSGSATGDRRTGGVACLSLLLLLSVGYVSCQFYPVGTRTDIDRG